MRRIIKILGIATVSSALLFVSLAGTAFAAGPNGDQDQLRIRDGSCDNVSTDCIPNENNHQYLSNGPHGVPKSNSD